MDIREFPGAYKGFIKEAGNQKDIWGDFGIANLYNPDFNYLNAQGFKNYYGEQLNPYYGMGTKPSREGGGMGYMWGGPGTQGETVHYGPQPSVEWPEYIGSAEWNNAGKQDDSTGLYMPPPSVWTNTESTEYGDQPGGNEGEPGTEVTTGESTNKSGYPDWYINLINWRI